MTERANWAEVKNWRRDSEGLRRGYQDAKDAFHLGARVRAERQRLGLTQSELAEKMGTTQPTIARLEVGGVTPSLNTLHRAAEALGLELVVDFHRPAPA